MKKTISIVMSLAIFYQGCAGRQANPVPLYIPGDENRSCDSLKKEVVQLQKDMAAMLPKTDKFGTNALWATAGVFLIVPFFFMDMKDAEKIEFEAMRQRHNRLLVYLESQKCDVNDITSKPIPSLEQQKKEAEEMLKQQKTQGKEPANNNKKILYCGSCGREIKNNEVTYVCKGQIVCSGCYTKLKSQQ